MIRKPLILAGLAVALLATPAFAQSAPSAQSSDPTASQREQIQPQGSVSAPGAVGAQPVAPNNTTDQAPAKSPYSQGMAKPTTAGGSGGGNVPVNNASTGTGSAKSGANTAGVKTKHASTTTHHKVAENCYNYAYQSAQMNNCLAHSQTAGVNGMSSSGPTGGAYNNTINNGRGINGNEPSANNPVGKGPTTP